MKQEKDILKDRQELKKMPYKTPDGYFEYLRIKNMKTLTDVQVCRRPANRALLYTAAAAAVTLLVAAGGFFLTKSEPADHFTEEDYLVFSDEMTDAIYNEVADQYASMQKITQEDIVEYLIHTGTEIEDIYITKNI